MSAPRSWPTVAEVDAERGRWWWVDGEPSRLHVDRMKYPQRVMWHARYVEDLPIDMFGGPVLRPGEVPLSPDHRGMRVSASGLLARVARGCDLLGQTDENDEGLDDKGLVVAARLAGLSKMEAFSLKELLAHLKELSDRFYAGDIGVVDEFLQLYSLDDKRPGGRKRGGVSDG